MDMMSKLRAAAKKNQGVQEPAAPAPEPEKTPDKPKEKTVSALSRLKAGRKSAEPAKEQAREPDQTASTPTPSSAESAEAPAINPPAVETKEPAPAKKKAKRKTTKKTAKKAGAPTLYIGCYPVQGVGEVTQLHDFLADVKAAVCAANDVAHWDFLEYGKGSAALAGALAEKISEEGVPPVLCAEPFSSESRAVEQVLLQAYEVVIRGLR